MVGINNTTGFYAGDGPPSLFWELTICQSLAAVDSPYQQALRRRAPYGRLLAEFLVREVGLTPGWPVVEVGGGYGTLMSHLLDPVPLTDLTLVDVSPFFSTKQQAALADHGEFRFVVADAVAYFQHQQRSVELVIANENLGDFPTVTGIHRDTLQRARNVGGAVGPLAEVAAAANRYGLELADAPEIFHFNLGAIRFLESLAPVARRVFLSEHCADPVLPEEYRFLPLPTGDGYPREILLKGHSEYTIRFAHLARVAEYLGYRVKRGTVAELVGLRSDPGLQAMARVRSTASETAELIHEFCEHVAEYQWLLLER